MADGNHLTVLLVDDDEATLRLLSRYLEKDGYHVLTAPDGERAMEVMLMQAPTVVVTDWSMPGMSGADLCRAIRTHEAIGFTYIIMLTAHTEESHIIEAFEAGADDFLAKPLNKRELLARLWPARRIIALQQDLARRNRDARLFNAQLSVMQEELERANRDMESANTELEKANARLTDLANLDDLTGLLNRREAMARLTDLWAISGRSGSPLSCILLDIDHFKSFNDRWGHDIGDLVLRETAAILQNHVRAGESACRIGGEEFLIILPETSAENAEHAAERLRTAIERTELHTSVGTLKITVSMGVAGRTAALSSPDELLKIADDALYHAKRTGRNRVCVGPIDPAQEASTITQQSSPEPRHQAVAQALGFMEDTERDAVLAPVSLRACVVGIDATRRNELSALVRDICAAPEEAANVYAPLCRPDPPDLLIVDASQGHDVLGTLTHGSCAHENAGRTTILWIGPLADRPAVIRTVGSCTLEYQSEPICNEELRARIRALAAQQFERLRLEGYQLWCAEHSRAMTLLLDYSRGLAVAESLNTVLESAVSVVSEMACSRRVAVLLPRAEQETLSVAWSLGIDPRSEAGLCLSRNHPLLKNHFDHGHRLLINSATSATQDECALLVETGIRPPLLLVPLHVAERLVGAMVICGRQGDAPFAPHESEYLRLVCNMTAWAVHATETSEARDLARDSILAAMAKIAEYRDSCTGRHLERVKRFALLLAEQLGRRPRYRTVIHKCFLRDLERAVPMHDVGKVAVPDAVLLKPGKLTREEMQIMRRHALVGTETIASIARMVPNVSFLRMAQDIAMSHHEWYNGNGYPEGLSGDRIPVAARLVAVADAYDAMTSPRIYRQRLGHEQACSLISDAAGTQFDPEVVRAFEAVQHEFARLADELADGPPSSGFPSRITMCESSTSPDNVLEAAWV